ncbi:MAG: dolichyl-phosphate-mannose--protein mannosyltransferase [Pseudoclavibacter sp.]
MPSTTPAHDAQRGQQHTLRHATWHEPVAHWFGAQSPLPIWLSLKVLGPAAVTLLAAVLRLWNLGWPNTLVFDETYYVKDAWTLGARGNEARWPESPNPAVEAGDVNSFLSGDGAFVVHPPLGKWMMWLGMLAGPEHAWAWRLSTAIAGILTVLLVCVVAQRMFHSAALSTFAGGLLAIDGLAITMSRTGLLDVFIGLFVLAAFWMLLIDRSRHRRMLAERLHERGSMGVVWWRPWLFAAAVFLGCATSVKWSGVYFAVAFGLYTVVDDLLARRRLARAAGSIPMRATSGHHAHRQTFWARAWPLQSLAQAGVGLVTVLPTVVLVYLASWTGWFVTSNGWGRHWAESNPAEGWLAVVPDALRSFGQYHAVAYRFHTGLDSPHPWASSPLSWPIMLKPTLFWRTIDDPGENGCLHDSGCVSTISSVANPLLWWVAHLAVLTLIVFVIVRVLRRSTERRPWRVMSPASDVTWQAVAILFGFAGGYLPWLMYLHRTVFFFYAVAWQPFLILAVVAVVRMLVPPPQDDSGAAVARRVWARPVVAGFVVLVVAVSAFFYPLWTGMDVSRTFWSLHAWLPHSWL